MTVHANALMRQLRAVLNRVAVKHDEGCGSAARSPPTDEVLPACNPGRMWRKGVSGSSRIDRVGSEDGAVDADALHGLALRGLYRHHATGAATHCAGHELLQRELCG